ncbi:MAG: hypothetical protein GY832_28695 [Chloroflexi bacterium]|nr:hypothetical protein [Chloroflexota bacterium]
MLDVHQMNIFRNVAAPGNFDAGHYVKCSQPNISVQAQLVERRQGHNFSASSGVAALVIGERSRLLFRHSFILANCTLLQLGN